MTTAEQLLADIRGFIETSGMSESGFGKAAVSDPNFVSDLRQGREPSTRLLDKVRRYIQTNSSGAMSEVGDQS